MKKILVVIAVLGIGVINGQSKDPLVTVDAKAQNTWVNNILI